MQRTCEVSSNILQNKKGTKRQRFFVSKTWLSVKLCFIILLFQAVTFPAAAAQNITGLQLHIREQDVVMDNGILQVTLSKPAGMVTGIQYNGVDNLLEILNEDSNRG
ncbi:uncharacterized protein LOC110756134 [Prunus avium]|uniref:Uncharacterized protein LOC110756134 n=1 Tax=Prunus avium TaxID=42229 RepID=A0A6P5SHG2_PRUAV|nr:uncharacterized protein LOC110756134 [Prunus avium]